MSSLTDETNIKDCEKAERERSAATLFAGTASCNAATTSFSTTRRLTRTRKTQYSLKYHCYFHAVYRGDDDRDVERLYGLCDSLNVGLSNEPGTGLYVCTQHRSSHHVTGISQLYNMQQSNVI